VLGLLGCGRASPGRSTTPTLTQPALLPHQWQVRPSDLIYVAVGVACQFIVDAAYIPFHVHHLNRPVNHLFGSVVGASFVLLIIMTTFLAPIMEEWLFRGCSFER